MKAKDWIILRLVCEITSSEGYVYRTNSNVMRSIMYLMREYGTKHTAECINQLIKEMESRNE